jgi:glycosyltransferase involved in cell wall biosynthesis
MVVNEAMNFGLPVIVSDKVGCAPDLVQNGGNGYVFEHRSAEQLATALFSLVTDARLRAQLGCQSLERISVWSPQVAAQGLVDAAITAAKTDRGDGCETT